jgi:outer membrane protein assembly factor BamA
LARSLAFANFELRAKLAEIKFKKQCFAFELASFFDTRTVKDDWQALNFSNIKSFYGYGIRMAWNQSTVLSCDYGISKKDHLFYFGIGQAF